MTLRIYGRWAGNPKGRPEDVTRCIEEVGCGERGAIGRQCERKRGFGPDGLYCKQHDPAQVKRRKKASAQRFQKDQDARLRPYRQAEAGRKLAEAVLADHEECAPGLMSEPKRCNCSLCKLARKVVGDTSHDTR